MLSKEIDDFCLLALEHEEKSIQTLFNYYIQKNNNINADNFIFFIEAAEECRRNDNKNIIKEKLKK